jgi:V/A-type H+-transporting ATPase subunit D
VPKIESSGVQKPLLQRGYGVINTSARIDEAASAYEKLVEQVIISAEIESAMKKLLEDIEKTKRRVNALEFKVIPEQKEAEQFIKLRLEEMERESTFRLKRIKA